MLKLESLILGGVKFGKDEEYSQFRFRLLYVSLATGVVTCGALILVNWLQWNDLGHIQLAVLEVFFLLNLLLLILLWGRRRLFAPVAWSFFAGWFLVDVSALLFVPNDEFRPAWFFLQVAAAYAILGLMPGVVTAALALASVVVANRYLPVPFSTNAMVTIVFVLGVVSVFLYVYTYQFISSYRRITEANELLRNLASRDPLTGIQNARAFNDGCNQTIRQALRSGAPFSALFVDLDHFKSINDRYGHDAGDMVLKEVAACLTRHSRESDALGRIGGDEFMLLLPDTDLSGAKSLAEKLRTNVEALMPTIGATCVQITVSIGVAGNQPDDKSIADIRRHADQAMYEAKAAGRNRVVGLGPT